MNQLVDKAIILNRTNYGEADRILTALTPNYGKISLMAKGVRRAKSKLAGGVELLSISQITFIRGRGEVSTLTSSRLEVSYSNIIKDIKNIQLSYDLLKLIDKNTERNVESDYFDLLANSLAALDDQSLPLELVRAYFQANLLSLAGHAPNLEASLDGKPLNVKSKYSFDVNEAYFYADHQGQYDAEAIKFLRLVFSGNSPKALNRINGVKALASSGQPLLAAMIKTHLRI